MEHDRLSTEYQHGLIKADERQKILIHDIKKHLYTILSLLKNEEYNYASTYIDCLIDSSELNTITKYSDNEVLNIILSRYEPLFKEQQTQYITDIRDKSLDYVTQEDLTTIFCNLLDNALTATASMKDSFVELSANIDNTTNYILITLVNSCLIDPFDNKSGILKKNSNSNYHGYGLKSVKNVIEKYDGLFQIYYDNADNTFHTVITLKRGKL